MKRDISEELKVIDTFFTLFEDPNAKVDELIEKCREIFFVKPIVIAISEHYLKDYKETFTKLHLFWLKQHTVIFLVLVKLLLQQDLLQFFHLFYFLCLRRSILV